MTACPPQWGDGSRFYLPNEDAGVVREALGLLRGRVRRPFFVGGSGMVLLEAVARLPLLERAVFVDIASFQLEYFQEVLHAVAEAKSPAMLRTWFIRRVYPRLRDHFRQRGREYPLEQVLTALAKRFGVSFFFMPETLRLVQAALGKIVAFQGDVVSHLVQSEARHDFIYLSNVPDYLKENELYALFLACWAHRAPVYLLLTTSCADQNAAQHAWIEAGYVSHPEEHVLNQSNRGLGSITLNQSWNRPGRIRLLLPADERRV